MKNELFIGDAQQGVGLGFERDGLWVWGYLGTIEIPHKMIPWAEFEAMRKRIEFQDKPTLYETYKRERNWNSSQPDMRAFMDAVHFYFPRESFSIEGRYFKQLAYEKPEEHLVLVLRKDVVWDFGQLYNEPDVAYAVAFRRFEEHVDTIQDRAKRLSASPWWERLKVRCGL